MRTFLRLSYTEEGSAGNWLSYGPFGEPCSLLLGSLLVTLPVMLLLFLKEAEAKAWILVNSVSPDGKTPWGCLQPELCVHL